MLVHKCLREKQVRGSEGEPKAVRKGTLEYSSHVVEESVTDFTSASTALTVICLILQSVARLGIAG
jgi:hypothetical protein